MNRNAYHNNQDYRQGYDDGLKDGREQALTIVGYRLSTIMASCDQLLQEIQDIKETERR